MTETIPQIRARHRQEIKQAVSAMAERRVTQSKAARELETTLSVIGYIISKEGIFWPVKKQGVKTQ